MTLPPIVPGPDPVTALARELAGAGHDLGLGWTVAEVGRYLDAGDLVRLADELLLATPRPRRRRLLLVVDQFEELLTQTAEPRRAQFVDLLQSGLTGPVRVVATLRSEFLDPLLTTEELSALPKRIHVVQPLRREALHEVVEGPARVAGL
ncbi:MAG: hypothetical protein QOK35_1980, partial [Pseudonocardiales bacterium]|nr:hypothetical protein [Pseudonocardiales bacterium]